MTSVSTISTDMSRSLSNERERRHKASRAHETSKAIKPSRTKLSRERSSSRDFILPHYKNRANILSDNDQGVEFRRQAFRLNGGGRGRGSDREMPNATLESSHKRMRSSSSSMSYSSGSSYIGRGRSQPVKDDRRTRPRRSSTSPGVRGRDRWSRAPRNSRKSRSRTISMDRSRIARERRSITPDYTSPWDKGNRCMDEFDVAGSHSSHANNNDRYGGSSKGTGYEHHENLKPVPLMRKERSLSPFSKRIALTQAMNIGK